MVEVTFVEAGGLEHAVSALAGQTLMQAAVNNRIPGILAECGGACACATCHVFVGDDWVGRIPPASDFEKGMLEGAIGPRDTSRLACQIVLDIGLNGLKVDLPEEQI